MTVVISDIREEQEVVTWSAPSMGGTVNVTISTNPQRAAEARRDARRVAQRVEAWAARLTRFTEESDLSRLNATRDDVVCVRPTLATALAWARTCEERSRGIVDATLLDARLAAERGGHGRASPRRPWQLVRSGRGAKVHRNPGVRFDLDGLAKGWIADRASGLLLKWPSAAVDADGDVSVRLAACEEWLVDVQDPRVRGDGTPLATFRLRGRESWSDTFGVATSGTSVHRWQHPDGTATHHLIDPRTGSSANTDIVQATVIAPTAAEAEMLAKTAVILGAAEASPFLDRSAAYTALLLLESGDVIAKPGVEKWLA